MTTGFPNKRLSEEFEDTKGVISICKWKDRQDNGQESEQARQRSRVRTGKTMVKSQDRQDNGQESGQARQRSRVRTGKTKVKSQDRQDKGQESGQARKRSREKVQKDKQRSTKHTLKTKDRLTRTH